MNDLVKLIKVNVMRLKCPGCSCNLEVTTEGEKLVVQSIDPDPDTIVDPDTVVKPPKKEFNIKDFFFKNESSE